MNAQCTTGTWHTTPRHSRPPPISQACPPPLRWGPAAPPAAVAARLGPGGAALPAVCRSPVCCCGGATRPRGPALPDRTASAARGDRGFAEAGEHQPFFPPEEFNLFSSRPNGGLDGSGSLFCFWGFKIDQKTGGNGLCRAAQLKLQVKNRLFFVFVLPNWQFFWGFFSEVFPSFFAPESSQFQPGDPHADMGQPFSSQPQFSVFGLDCRWGR